MCVKHKLDELVAGGGKEGGEGGGVEPVGVDGGGQVSAAVD